MSGLAQIGRRFIAEMVAHAQEDLPNECCGIVAGEQGHVIKVYRMTNVEASPFRFSMDPREVAQVDQEAGENGWDLMAIYHSHTRSEAFPSDTDIRIAGGTSELWPDVRYILVSLLVQDNPQVRLFRIDGGVVTEEALEIIPYETR
ncbi:MAG: M67 family metallopeptidase [Chloroflexota bacterium]